jgi:hypothetical protein
MTRTGLAAAALMAGVIATTASFAQQPQTVRLRGAIEKIDGHTVTAKSTKGDDLKLNLADKVTVVAVTKASMTDIREGEFIGSGAMPQPDGSQKAIEVHIFAESMRGTGEGFRPWGEAAPRRPDCRAPTLRFDLARRLLVIWGKAALRTQSLKSETIAALGILMRHDLFGQRFPPRIESGRLFPDHAQTPEVAR